MLQDLRYTLRTFRSRPAVAFVAVMSLAIGLGAAGGAVSVLGAFGFTPPAVRDSDALVEIRSGPRNSTPRRMSYPDFEDLRDHTQTLSSVSAYGLKGAGLSGPEGPPEIAILNAVSFDYFQTLGVEPALGRRFLPDDASPGARPAVVLSDRLWRRRFAADPGIIHRTIDLNGIACDVIGVAPRDFSGLDLVVAPDLWIPIRSWVALSPGDSSIVLARDQRWLTVVGRLRAGVPPIEGFRMLAGKTPSAMVQAQAEIDGITANLRDAYPATNRDQHAVVIPEVVARRGGLVIVAVLLWALVGLVILVGCANVAGLLLGRAEERKREMAIRIALGAGRRRLIRQLLTEGLALSGLAGLAGLALATWIVRALPALLPPMAIPLGVTFQLDGRVVVATLVLSVGTVLVFALWPALVASRTAVAEAARTDSTSGGRSRRWSARNLLVVGQIAVSFALLAGGALLVRSASNIQSIDPGFEIRPLLLVSLSPAAVGYDGSRTQAFYRDLVEQLGAAPGIERVSLARRIPLDPNGGGAFRDVVLPDRPAPLDGAPLHIKFNCVLPNYFDMMGTHLAAGRAFTERDGSTTPKVVVINETMAKLYWPGRPAVGQRLRVTGPGSGDYDVVGIVRDGKVNRLTEEPEPYMFFAQTQVPSSDLTLIVQAGADPTRAASTVREVLRRLDPRLPTMQMLTLSEHMRFASYEADLSSTIVGSLSVCGVLLSVIGLYGVISFVVARRTKEIGVRMALGAEPADIFRDVMGRALVLTLCGVGIGAVLAGMAMAGLGGSLYGISPWDPATFSVTAAALTAIALGASWWPGRRAMRIDPVQALRSE
jgi:predicted permease